MALIIKDFTKNSIMVNSSKQKIRLMFLYDLLRKNTDEENPMPTNTIISTLKQQGFSISRKTLYEDIELLNKNGYEVLCKKSRSNCYFVVDRAFELAEVQMLLSAVGANKSLSDKKANALMNKLYDLLGVADAEKLNDLIAYAGQEKYSDTIAELFSYIIGDDEHMNAQKQTELELNIQRYTDYRTYLKFDLEVTDSDGHTQQLSKTIKSKSGGESQTPFYIAMVAAFSQLYNTNEKGDRANTVRLVVFDEAFNKMDSDRYTECINLFRESGLQAIMCAPEKIDEISPLVDNTLLVYRDGYNMQVLPWAKLQDD